jgi:hypothetical protein
MTSIPDSHRTPHTSSPDSDASNSDGSADIAEIRRSLIQALALLDHIADHNSQKKRTRLRDAGTQTTKSYLLKKSTKSKPTKPTIEQTEILFEDDSSSVNEFAVPEDEVRFRKARKGRFSDQMVGVDEKPRESRGSSFNHMSDLSRLSSRLDELEARVNHFSVGGSRPK